MGRDVLPLVGFAVYMIFSAGFIAGGWATQQYICNAECGDNWAFHDHKCVCLTAAP